MSLLRLCFVTVTLCVSCGGSSFQSASGGDSGAAGGGGTAAGGNASGGSTGVSGSASRGGSPGGGSAGEATGGVGTGGVGAGGSSAGAGGSGVTECERLRTEYGVALEKARGCDSGSTDQCSTNSTLPSLGCGCPVLVNSKSESTNVAKQKYQAFVDAMCNAGPVCQIACLEPVAAACAPQMTAAGTAYQCAGGIPATH